MYINKRAFKKHKHPIKKVFWLGIFVFCLAMILGGGVYYYVAIKLHQPAYISPLAAVLSAQLPSQEDKRLVTLKKQLAGKKIDFSSIVASESSYAVLLPNGSQVVLSSEKDVSLQISSLQFILSRLTMEGREFSRLDLRFDKPIIVFKKVK